MLASLTTDPETGVDILAAAMLEFPTGHSIFSCGMQLSPSQQVALMGGKGRISFDVPWSPYTDRPTRLIIDRSEQLEEPMVESVAFEPCNQYTLLAEGFSQAAKNGAAAPLPLEDSVKNMAVLDALARSATSGRWEAPGALSSVAPGSPGAEHHGRDRHPARRGRWRSRPSGPGTAPGGR